MQTRHLENMPVSILLTDIDFDFTVGSVKDGNMSSSFVINIIMNLVTISDVGRKKIMEIDSFPSFNR
jgi:hypothetical protein